MFEYLNYNNKNEYVDNEHLDICNVSVADYERDQEQLVGCGILRLEFPALSGIASILFRVIHCVTVTLESQRCHTWSGLYRLAFLL